MNTLTLHIDPQSTPEELASDLRRLAEGLERMVEAMGLEK